MLLAWTLLASHFHLVVRIGELGLSRGMQWLNGGYAVVGQDPTPVSLALAELLAHFGDPPGAAVERYRAFTLGAG